MIDQLKPRSMGHNPHRAIVGSLRKYLNTLTTYREPIINSYNHSSEIFERFFDSLSDEFPGKKDKIEEFKRIFLNEFYKPLVNQFEVLYFSEKYFSEAHVEWREK